MRSDYPKFRRLFWNRIMARVPAAGTCARTSKAFVDKIDWARFFDAAPSPQAVFEWAALWGSQPAFADFGPQCGAACVDRGTEAAARAFCAIIMAKLEDRSASGAKNSRPGAPAVALHKGFIRAGDSLFAEPDATPAAHLCDYFIEKGNPAEPSAFRLALADALARCADSSGWKSLLPFLSPREHLGGAHTPSLWILALDRAFAHGVLSFLPPAPANAVDPDSFDLAHFLVREAERENSVAHYPGALGDRINRLESTAAALRMLAFGAQIHSAGSWAPGQSLLNVAARSEVGNAVGDRLLRAGAQIDASANPGRLIQQALEHNSATFADALLQAGAKPQAGREVEWALRRCRPRLALSLALAGARFEWPAYLRGAPTTLGENGLFQASISLDGPPFMEDAPESDQKKWSKSHLDERFWMEHQSQRKLFLGLRDDFKRFDAFSEQMKAHIERVLLLDESDEACRSLANFGLLDIQRWTLKRKPAPLPPMDLLAGEDGAERQDDKGKGDTERKTETRRL